MNKETAGNVLSLLLQSGYAGRAEIGLVGNDDLVFRVSSDGTSWKEVLRADSTTGEAVIGNMRIGRNIVQNLLPDSGRFNGNANNSVFNGIGWSAPTYLSPVSGCTIASYARFIHDNSDYGGVQPSLNANVRDLIEEIRPSSARRYGPEWYVMQVTQSSSANVEPQTIAGVQHGIVFANSLTALPEKFTIGYYIKVESGTAAIRANSGNVKRLAIDGVEVPTGAGAAPVVIGSEDGWKYVNLQSQPNIYAYDVTAFQLMASASAQLLFAMPKIAFGHLEFDPDQGVLMNGKMFG